MPARPKHQPTPSTRAVVKALISFGIDKEHIAVRLGCHIRTLERNYKREIAEGRPDMLANVARALYLKAIDAKGGMASVKAGELIMKALGGWRDNYQHIEHSGDGSPMGAGTQQVVLILPENSRDLPQIAARRALPMIEAAPVEEGVIIESE